HPHISPSFRSFSPLRWTEARRATAAARRASGIGWRAVGRLRRWARRVSRPPPGEQQRSARLVATSTGVQQDSEKEDPLRTCIRSR
uniref:Uncharacterized protein n=1 Tax=Leersia perrieri TaxID=77586 RepID=A0A0D9XBQ0_9ORYZ